MIYELRIYSVHPGRLADLLAQFRDDVAQLFESHGMTNVGYWTNLIGGRNDELWYMLSFADLAHRERAWRSFLEDPEWHVVRAKHLANGPLVHHIENRIMAPTDFSRLS